MLKPIRSILFATDLTPNCQPALDFSLSLATSMNAKVYMLHVIEPLPENMDERLKDLLGAHQWEKMVASHEHNARKSLLGKQSTNSVIRETIYKFCKQEGIDSESCNFEAHQILISDGEIIADILKAAEENSCDLIVVGGQQNSLFFKTPHSTTAKGLLKKSKIPVTVVPAIES